MQAFNRAVAEDVRVHRPSAPASRREAQRGAAVQTRRWTRWERISTLACIALSAGVVWFVASTGAAIQQMSNQIDRLQTQIQRASAENATLAAQVDTLSKPDRILSKAEKLGARYASPVQIVPGTAGH
ncbi:septum formation initiator family protein [Alicyclobacillus macrosporangiidus]|uniref:septum formation initiator family protein n=1 Tax=Alicyclobacillus macrosporangiidus TaxID=392015 RepID=UPI000495657A|nr:septum formation initiator family protein [Alicyclobacillus macrosporangiidus]